MAIPSGLSNQLMLAQESAYGVFTTPNRALEYNSEGLTVDKQVLRSRSVGDQFQRSGRSRHYIRGGGGPIELPVMNKGMGLLFKHMLGNVVSAQVGETDEYTHTYTPAADGGAGDSLTIQKGLADTSGTVQPFTYLGMKVVSWELVQAMDANLLLRLTFDAKTVATGHPLAVASYPSLLVPLSFIDASLTVDGGEICVREFSVGGTRALDVNRRCLGNTKREPVANGEYEITGAINREFEGMAQYDAWIAGTPGELVARWEFGEIEEGGNPFALVVTLPEIEYTGETPQSNGSEIVLQNLPYKALYNGTDPIITIVQHTSDATP